MKRIWAILIFSVGCMFFSCPYAIPSSYNQVAELDNSFRTTMFEVKLGSGADYTLLLEKKDRSSGGFPLKIYRGNELAYETMLIGETGQVCLINARGNGKIDLVAILAGATQGEIKYFIIIGSDEHGNISLLSDEILLVTEGYKWPRLSKVEGRIALEYTPDGAWTRHRAWLEWDGDEGTYIISPVGRITPRFAEPATDKTIYFALGPDNDRIWYHDKGEPVDVVRLHIGETMLLKRDDGTDEEGAVGCRSDCGAGSIAEVKFAGGNYIVSAKRPGSTKLELFQPDNPLAVGAIYIIIE